MSSITSQEIHHLVQQSRKAWPGLLRPLEIAGLCACGLLSGLPTFLLAGERTTSLYLLVAAQMILNSLYLCHQLKRQRIYRQLQTLPDYSYSEQARLIQSCCGLLSALLMNLVLWGHQLNAHGYKFAAHLESGLMLTVIVLTQLVIWGGGNELMALKRRGQLIYQDAIRASATARQDLFYSRFGSYRDGLILGYRIFPYAEIERYDREKRCLSVLAKSEDGNPYRLLLYTPRLIAYADPKIYLAVSQRPQAAPNPDPEIAESAK